MPKLAAGSWFALLLAVLTALGLVTLWQADPRVGRIWLNTALLAAGAIAIAVPLGTLAAVAIFKTDVLGRRLAAVLFTGMLFVPLYVVTGAWDAGFGIQGWQTMSTNPHLAREPWLAGWRAAIWVHALASVPWVVLIVGAGLRAVEPEIEEDAATCTTPLRVIWHITLRRVAPAIVVAGVWVAIIAVVEISVTDFFQIRTFAEEVYTQSALGTLDFSGEQGAGSAEQQSSTESKIGLAAPGSTLPGLSATGLWTGVLLAAALALVALLAASGLLVQLTDPPHRPPWIWRLQWGRLPATIGLWSIVFLVAGLPLANLVYKAGIRVTAIDPAGRVPARHVRSWSPTKVVERVAAAPREFRGELWLSARIGAAAATGAIAIALPLAWTMRRSTHGDSGPPGLRLAVLALCLTIPGPLLGVALIHVLNRPPESVFAPLAGLYDSNFAPWLVQTIRALPLATLVLWPALSSIPQPMLDAAATEGAGSLGRLWRIAVPQRWPAVAAAWLVSLAIAVGELAATVLVIPPQTSTAISVRVFQLLHYGVDDRVAAICLVMVAAIAILTGIVAALLKRNRI
jgi:iron(III) transport system permease protein